MDWSIRICSIIGVTFSQILCQTEVLTSSSDKDLIMNISSKLKLKFGLLIKFVLNFLAKTILKTDSPPQQPSTPQSVAPEVRVLGNCHRPC